MSNKTFIPAFRAKVGDWQYYICIMKYGEVARQVGFAHEMGGNKDLNSLIQRGITDRTAAITQYLLRSEHRFLGALIVAAYGGEPTYISVGMQDPDGMLSGIDQGFGVLTFDGTQSYFALDGQHRLRAIKDAITQNPDLGKEDICVIMVSHYDTPDGKIKTRRLFTNINRNAKATTAAENIALDVDDGVAIVTRRLLTDHPWLRETGVVKVFTRVSEDGDIKLAPPNLGKGEAKAFTTMAALYDMLKELDFGLDSTFSEKGFRPTDEVLDSAYDKLSARLDALIDNCGALRARMRTAKSARDVRAPKHDEGAGHPFMRPVVQKAITKVLGSLVQQFSDLDDQETHWKLLVERLSRLTWRMDAAPWIAVYAAGEEESGKMITGKDHTELLSELLVAHLAPRSKNSIKNVRKKYQNLKGQPYPVSEEEMFAAIDAEGPAQDPDDTTEPQEPELQEATSAEDTPSAEETES